MWIKSSGRQAPNCTLVELKYRLFRRVRDEHGNSKLYLSGIEIEPTNKLSEQDDAPNCTLVELK